ncbi:uncharacterized protein LOC111598110 [Drosophila hydei]|uniref:Uncharacterized protein LOC111598110 n=1 Tax=Drosophila hydei TaxID=7224 RepID=A0A6J2SRM5_DROHY|nr:uncharacterized protein LOC111598110 [Drosophila hydei]
MDSLGNNRYQLLFIDDEASDVCVGQKKLQEFDDNPKLKCNKLPGSEKLKSLVLGKKTANQTKSSGKGEQGPKSDRSKATNGTFMINGGQKSKFDRHSGSDKTGIKAVVKRNGGGAHNWGSLQQQGDNCMEEDDTKYITVEEWRAMRVERAKPIYNIRKAGEGEANKPDWKKMIVLPKKKPLKSDSDSGLEYDASMYPQRVGRQQRVMNIEFKFKDDRRRSGYLSGWVAGRSMAKCEVESVSDPINMNDEAEFPTLG